ncbi:hypothetical protein BDK51DRAFT_37106 [Blyttiomyces helicus]|uniref:Uncharacterized protein n=1 Tax=Blyttiomyces helicus TaxID=388810 RepID=A0A4P9WAI9_9FUNG|nr:hypothetical protein BDK51DRAFT_37106 [Blyttiomyces helicus]|eukprot:RKO88168.1 hypothetical protein BDK51DRAFT_37106 [Blyttiomyces helicus]
MPSIPLLRLTLLMLMNIRVLELSTKDQSLKFTVELESVALILGARDRLIAFIRLLEEHLWQFRLNSEELAVVERRPKSLGLFWFDSFAGPTTESYCGSIRPNLEYLGTHGSDAHEHRSLPLGFFARLAPHAPSLCKVWLVPGPMSMTTDDDIVDLTNSFPGNQGLDLSDKFRLTPAVLELLYRHRPRKVLGIGSTLFTTPAVSTLLPDLGSLLKTFDIGRKDWAIPDICLDTTGNTLKLSGLLFSYCPHLLPSHATIDHLTASLTSWWFCLPGSR